MKNRADRKVEFSTRLKKLMSDKGVTGAHLVSEVKRAAGGSKFSGSHVSLYVLGKSIPRRHHMMLLSKALNCSVFDLTGDENDAEPTSFRITQLPGDMAHVYVDEDLPWPIALKVMHLIKGER